MVSAFFVKNLSGLELGASKRVCVFAKGEKTVQWTVLREAREKQVRSVAPRNTHHQKKVVSAFFVKNLSGLELGASKRVCVFANKHNDFLEREILFLICQ